MIFMAEYIDRNAAIDAANHALAKGLTPLDYIEMLPAITNEAPTPNWIDVRDRLPCNEGWYLAVVAYHPITRIKGGEVIRTVEWCSCGPDMPTMWSVPLYLQVTHWMRLPELPKEDNDG